MLQRRLLALGVPVAEARRLRRPRGAARLARASSCARGRGRDRPRGRCSTAGARPAAARARCCSSARARPCGASTTPASRTPTSTRRTCSSTPGGPRAACSTSTARGAATGSSPDDERLANLVRLGPRRREAPPEGPARRAARGAALPRRATPASREAARRWLDRVARGSCAAACAGASLWWRLTGEARPWRPGPRPRGRVAAPMKISACIIAKDEADRHRDCVESVRVLRRGAGARLRQHATARRTSRGALGARVVETDWPGYVAQKNRAADAAAQRLGALARRRRARRRARCARRSSACARRPREPPAAAPTR